MFKLIIGLLVILVLWGGGKEAISFTDNDGNFNISINKEQMTNSLISGANKSKNVLQNIDKLGEEK